MKVKFLILGAGPTGLGAAWRLNERGETDWLVLEKTNAPGGLAGSITDDQGYTWDMGGHVQFSHYAYFTDLMDALLEPDEWLHHERESWVRLLGQFVPYPFQNNLRYLPREAMWECVAPLLSRRNRAPEREPRHFGDWVRQSFGEGICRYFMEPYNFKVWAWPLEELSHRWIGDRVAVVDVERMIENIILERDDVAWGPNATFRFPRQGGTGEVWRRCAARLPGDRLRMNTGAARIDTVRRAVRIDGADEEIEYESLISSIPLDQFVAMTDLAEDAEFKAHAAMLRHSSTHVIGLGVRGRPSEEIKTKCWMYFPEDNCPFYRVTVFSNYSPNNVPDIAEGWSLMCEVSESPVKPVDAGAIVEQAAGGAVATGLVNRREDIVHTFYRRLPYGYPTPSLDRDRALEFLQPRLMERGIFSRGRFGAWKYETSNQDHSFMQGVECVDHVLDGSEEVTLLQPEKVNMQRPEAEKEKREDAS